jgi:hypothetical protein
MLDQLPNDVTGICKIAKQQSIHHNLLPYFDVPADKWNEMKRAWPSGEPITGIADMLAILEKEAPHNLYDKRKVEQRIIGACMTESIFLTSLLRHKNIPARIRAGYFKNTMGDHEHIINFWEKVMREKGRKKELLAEDPNEWKKLMNTITKKSQIDADKHIEHWITEYWDEKNNQWRLLDANNMFLKASSNINVGFHLPKKHFEFAHEAWQKMRKLGKDYNPGQNEEWPQDGRSHIRSQMLMDFYNLLNHDMAGFKDRSGDVAKFVKQKDYSDVSQLELDELDALAKLLAKNPAKDELVSFYFNSKTMRIASAEKDRYSFVYNKSMK